METLDRLIEDVIVVQRTYPYQRRDPARPLSSVPLSRSGTTIKARSLREIRN